MATAEFSFLSRIRARLLRPAGWRGALGVLSLVLVLHVLAAAVLIRSSNQDSTASDQGAEMWLAATARGDVFPQRTDGVRHPLWSWMARHLYVEDAAAFFARGKWLNTALCMVFLAGLGFAAARWLDLLALANLLFLASLGILLVRGTYFQPEPLYYLFGFLAMVLGWRLFAGAGLATWAGFGVVCGLAYLSKPSLVPFLLVFGGVMALRLGFNYWHRIGTGSRDLAGLVLAGVLLALLLTPLGLFSASHFGKPFFNYTKFWMWMDDFEAEAWPFQSRYPGGVQLKTLRPEDTPSAAWYFRRHSPADAAARLWEGTTGVATRFFFPEAKLRASEFFWRRSPKKWEQPLAHRGVYLLALTALTAGLAVAARTAVGPALREPVLWWRTLFVCGLVGIYLALYGWYWPIGKGDRFMGSLWIPAVFLVTWLAAVLRQRAGSAKADASYLAIHSAVLASLLLQTAGMFWRFSQGIFLVTRN
jgi:hypothetical protein